MCATIAEPSGKVVVVDRRFPPGNATRTSGCGSVVGLWPALCDCSRHTGNCASRHNWNGRNTLRGSFPKSRPPTLHGAGRLPPGKRNAFGRFKGLGAISPPGHLGVRWLMAPTIFFPTLFRASRFYFGCNPFLRLAHKNPAAQWKTNNVLVGGLLPHEAIYRILGHHT